MTCLRAGEIGRREQRVSAVPAGVVVEEHLLAVPLGRPPRHDAGTERRDVLDRVQAGSQKLTGIE